MVLFFVNSVFPNVSHGFLDEMSTEKNIASDFQ